MDERLTISQVAAALQMHQMSVTKLVLAGMIKSFKEGTRRYVLKSEVTNIIDLRERHGRKWMTFVTPEPGESIRAGSPQSPITR